MNIKQSLLVSATVMLLATGNVWAAASAQGCDSSGGQANGCDIPEIDAGSGRPAIVVLAGTMLLMWKRSRANRSSKADS